MLLTKSISEINFRFFFHSIQDDIEKNLRKINGCLKIERIFILYIRVDIQIYKIKYKIHICINKSFIHY